MVSTFPGEDGDWAGNRYGNDTVAPFNTEEWVTFHQPALGLGYSTTVTGPNPSGSVTVTVGNGTVDVPGNRVQFTASPASATDYIVRPFSTSAPLRNGETPVALGLGANLDFSAQPFLLLQTDETYTFAPDPHPSGRLAGVICTVGTATVDTVNNRFTITGQADRVQSSCALSFAQQPAITGISPATGPAAGGTVVTITGTNLSGVTAVRFGGFSAASFTIDSATQITATAPAGTGTVNVVAQINALPNVDTTSDDFTYQAAPTPPSPVAGIPTLSEWAMMLMGLLLAGVALARLRSLG